MTMECQICFESLSAFIDGELSPKEGSKIETHLSQCDQCQEEHQSLLYSCQLVEQTLEIEPDPNLWLRVRSEIVTPEVVHLPLLSTLRSLLTTRWVPAATTLVGAVGLSFFFVHQQNVQTAKQGLEDYIEQRERFEVTHVSANARSEATHPFHPNPFVVHNRDFQENPFRPE
jgi:hypothetical protein